MKKLLLAILLGLSAQAFSTPQISLISCNAGDDLYSIFGHSAIRIKDADAHTDVVYNFGMFSFNTDNFLYKFVKGETYYWLGKETFEDFIYSYNREGRAVFESNLNISEADAYKVKRFLTKNALPENSVYLYSYMFDNCATRIRDIIETTVGDSVVWKAEGNAFVAMPNEIADPQFFKDFYNNPAQYTYRDLLNVYLQKIPWVNWGIYFSVAAPSDKTIPYENAMFLPEFLLMGFQNATYYTHGIPNKLVGTATLLTTPKANETSVNSIFSPFLTLSLLLIGVGIVTYLGYKRKKWFWGIDATVLILTGLYGCAGAFVSWISIHPATFPNYNMLWANPFQLLWGILMFIPYLRKKFTKYVYNLFLLSLGLYILCVTFQLQALHWANVPLIITLAIRFQWAKQSKVLV